MNDIQEPDDDDIPESAFTSDAPGREQKEGGKGSSGPDGPTCPACKKDADGRVVQTWVNKTKNGHRYFRCSTCKGCWWPLRDDKSKVDPASKWPALEKKDAKD